MQLRRHILIASLLLPAAVFAAEPQTGTGENDGYRLVWQDLFDADALSPERWEIEVNGAGGGNNELQYYTDREENVRLGKDEHGNGCLILTARRESYKGKSFTSGRLITKNRVNFTHGKVEAAIKLPKTANGLWPAFWMMGNDHEQVGWPKCGEIDIMEFGHSNAYGAGKQEYYFNGACHWGQGWPAASHANSIINPYSLQDGEFHIYTCIWTAERIEMYVDLDRNPDAEPYFAMDFPCNEPDNEWSPGNYFHKPNFILFNLAVGGNFPGIHNAEGITALNENNGQQASMYVNYVKIYQKGTPDEELFSLIPGDKEESSSVAAIGTSSVSWRLDGRRISTTEACDIKMYDTTGRLVASAAAANTLNLEALPAGIYILQAGDDTRAKIALR
ncbi:MAG: family 16 glycosylhydrolase [Muribaculaceae bacterium]